MTNLYETYLQHPVVCTDTRAIVPDSLFFCLKGEHFDGNQFALQALENGAAFVVTENRELDGHDHCIVVDDALKTLQDLAQHHRQQIHIPVIGITGTNGKTTTVTLLYHLFRHLGYECGLLSTIANYVGTRRSETANTTTDPVTLNALLADMVEAGCEYCFMEVSSIGVEQQRIAGLEFRAAIFSNLTHDHLDYHGTFAEYLRCKKMFFDGLAPQATAIINLDDRHGEVMVQNTAARVVGYSCRSAADHTARILEQSPEGMLLRIDGREVWSRLIGAHNAYNLLAVYSAAVLLGAYKEEVLTLLGGHQVDLIISRLCFEHRWHRDRKSVV